MVDRFLQGPAEAAMLPTDYIHEKLTMLPREVGA